MGSSAEVVRMITNPESAAFIFSSVALLMASANVLGLKYQASRQLLGTLLVVALSFYANHAFVYSVSVFVVATLVTELAFLEKLAALIFRQKEYWTYLTEASKEDLTNKVRKEAEADIERSKVAARATEDEAESEGDQEQPGAAPEEPTVEILDSRTLTARALSFERKVLESLDQNKIPFAYDRVSRNLRIVSGAQGYLIDGIIETKDVHYIVEVKFAIRPSGLVDAVQRMEAYKDAYRKYLTERKIRVDIQPLIIVPATLNAPASYRNVPIVKFDTDSKTFINFKSSYAHYELDGFIESEEALLDAKLVEFLQNRPRWAYSPLRIQRLGAEQPGYEIFDLHSVRQIKKRLERLVEKGVLERKTSKKGNTLFKIKR